MVLKVCKYGAKVLREKAIPVNAVTDDLHDFAIDMLDTMYAAKGVGLAAEQVGRLEKVCVIDVPADCDEEADAAFNAPIAMPLVMFNPVIVAQEGTCLDKEGCLSFPKIGGSVVRAQQVTCSYLDIEGKPQTITARGYLARAIQHETDHLEGILYIDRMSDSMREEFSSKLKRLAKTNGGVR